MKSHLSYLCLPMEYFLLKGVGFMNFYTKNAFYYP